jgi:sec-independent protein translocase protein TatB
MFNVGPGEILLISVVALLLLGPDKLPELARGMGRFFREFRKHTDEVRSMVEREFYKMDQDVLQEAPKKESPSVSSVSASRFGLPPSEPAGADPRILPPPSFPAFPAPEGVVPSRPPSADVPLPSPHPTAAAESPASDGGARSDVQSDGVPGRDA